MCNSCMMQYFEWNLSPDGLLWRRAAAQAENLRALGVDMLWLPPAYKGAAGGTDVGYTVYDLYDLGEFDQKGSVRTKYGTRLEYLACLRKLEEAGIRVLPDVVLDHRMGADATEQVEARRYDPENRLQRISGEETIEAWTKYTFPGRKGKYSTFEWDWTCFSGIDWDAKSKAGGIYQFEGKQWSRDVDSEKGNYDYLMGANVDMANPKVAEELTAWGKWYHKTTHAAGYRLDALKHIDYAFYEKWIDEMRRDAHENLFFAGEYWSGNVDDLTGYLAKSGDRISLFDVPLHMNLSNASRGKGQYNMRELFNNTLVATDPARAVTFVDNHDTQPGQSLESWVEDWFKPLAYAAILLRQGGLPCVFYADCYGLRGAGTSVVPGLRHMLVARRNCAYGDQRDYFEHEDVLGWTRLGDDTHKNSGCAVLMTDAAGGEKEMYVGEQFAGRAFRDITRRLEDPVVIAQNGTGVFGVPGGAVSVWVVQEAYEDIMIHVE